MFLIFFILRNKKLNTTTVNLLPNSVPDSQVSEKKHNSQVSKKAYQIKGHLKPIMLNTSQETWKLDLPNDPLPSLFHLLQVHKANLKVHLLVCP
jgi:hypothetical protein